jgi:uncharacterized membrane protein YedE/YeeE
MSKRPRAIALEPRPVETTVMGRRFADPHLAGVGLGLVLLSAFVFAGRGLGASGAFASVAAGAIASVAPEHAADHFFFQRYLATGGPFREWLVFEIAGVFLGSALSARLAGRWRVAVERGPHVTARSRLALAFAGGTLMGAGAVFARGCTSGLALSGGALLGVGGWLFMLTAFAAGYVVAPWTKRAWR